MFLDLAKTTKALVVMKDEKGAFAWYKRKPKETMV